MASTPPDQESRLWSLLESRDRAFARAHATAEAMTRAATEKEHEIQRLTAWAREITETAALRQRLLDEALGSREHKLGVLLLHPLQVLEARLRKKKP